MKRVFGPEVYHACSKSVSVSLCETNLLPSEADDELPDSDLISDSTDILQIWPAYSHKTSVQPYMEVNDIEIGKAAVPSELMRVTYSVLL